MNVAFYAPLKSPDNPVPSGDRLIGRMLRQALLAGGHEVTLASHFRSFERDGDAVRQARIEHIGDGQARRVLRRLTASAKPDVWLTYHLYHKAPDWIGPRVAAGLGIPYCVAEASSSAKAATGPWAAGHAAVAAALAKAALVININPKDEAGIRPLLGPNTRTASISPFIDGALFQSARTVRPEHRQWAAAELGLDPLKPWLIAVGMLREGDKAQSYEILACAASMLKDREWQLIVVGDGGARRRIEACFAGLADRIRFAGLRAEQDVARLMAASDILVWPAINEAIGMVFIEAAMAGLPAVGARRPGIATVVDDGVTGLLVSEGDASEFAAAIARLLADRDQAEAMGRAAASRAAASNDIATAGRAFCSALERVVA